MQSRWSDGEALRFVERYARWGEDVALRVYTSRLIGSEPTLVMHGGGNTSVKSLHRDLFGDEIEAIHVKGSGWNLESIEPPGLPGLDLAYLRRLREVDELSDEEMVNQLRTHLFDASAPNPSVETLLHAFLPAKFVDHSHADAILALTNQERGQEWVIEALGDRVAIVPYVMPGFGLAKAAAQIRDENPAAEAMVLDLHGLFTWGETARESYERHVEYVTRAEAFLEHRAGRRLAPRRPAARQLEAPGSAAEAAPLLRGALARAAAAAGAPSHWILDFRRDAAIDELVTAPDADEALTTPPLTPDHVIRTKSYPLVVPEFDPADAEGWVAEVEEALADFAESYQTYFEKLSRLKGRDDLRQLDPLPRIVAVRDLGIFAVGASAEAAAIAGDLYQHTAEVKALVRRLGPYRALDDSELFDVEYWSLEQAKLGKGGEKPLARRVAFVTGAGGAIGSAIVEALALDGAAVVALDLASDALAGVVDRTCALAGVGACVGVEADVTDEASIERAFSEACATYGGVDLVVLNAGIARSAPIDRTSLEDWNRVLEVNLTGYFLTLREATRLWKRQGMGGNVVVIASKNAYAPGPEFAAYSVSKGGGHQLGRLAAIELAPLGVRVNMINPDAIFAHGEVTSGLWVEIGEERARARGLKPSDLPEYYRKRNLLKVPLAAEDVARAVLFFAREETPTTGATLPVDGGLPEAFPR
ncbi:MAG TPA: bifunctional aldolase/short-chain dehydrogenase [Thermoanaerobaculia bacterium]|nr:bifunctional aldolase/short-chain dehydrogenase [Thermoanaerobaculia bacterium]